MKRIEALVIGIIASLIASLIILTYYLFPLVWLAYQVELYIGTSILIVLIVLYLIWERSIKTKRGLVEVFEVFKPVEKLTPDDFHITKYDEFYIERESDKEIEALLGERKYVFISGIPMLGKTRMAYVAVKKLKGFYLLKPKYVGIDVQKLRLPFFKKKIVLFLDDLDKYLEKFNPDDLIRKVKKKSRDFVVVVTCRSGKEFEAIRACKEMETLLTECQKNKIEPRLLEKKEEQDLAEIFDKNLNNIASDGTPGSITIDLRYTKERYEQLQEEKSILKCLKLLRAGNIFRWSERLVKEVSKEVFGFNTDRPKWDNAVKCLSKNGFIKESNSQIAISHDVYLDDRFLDDYIVGDDDLVRLKEIFWQHKDTQNLFYLGNAFRYNKNQYEAIDCYKKSADIYPYSAETYVNLGGCFSELKRYDEAEKEYREALRIKPNFAEVHYNLGNLFYEISKYEDSEIEYKEALRIKPDIAEARTNLGVLLAKLKRFEEAEAEYRQALRINPDLFEVHTNFAYFLEKLKRYKEAEIEYREALRIKPDLEEAHYYIATLLYKLERYEEAEKEYRECLRINPKDYKAHNDLGSALRELNKYDDAKKEFQEAIRINPDDDKAHYNLGVVLVDLKRTEEAEKEYREALRINPDSEETHLRLGLLLCALKRPTEAVNELREALRINPDSAEAHGNLGILLMTLDRRGEAKKEFKLACDLFRKQERENDAKKAELFL